MPAHTSPSPQSPLTRSRAHQLLVLILLLLGLPRAASAEVLVQWIPSSARDLAGYVIYLTPVGTSFDEGFDIGLIGADPATGHASFDIETLVGPGTYSVAMTAYDASGLESRLSNVVQATVAVAPDCAVDADCDDGNSCNGAETCSAGVCEPGTPLLCAAGTCEVGRCDPERGCMVEPKPDGSVCDDGNPASFGDVCLDAVCGGSECLADADCQNDDRCDGTEVCVSGLCQQGAPPVCAPTDACRQGFCDPLHGCGSTPLPDGEVCDDDDPTTAQDACRAGVCIGEPIQTDACADAFGKPSAPRLGLREDAPGMIVIWDAPAHPSGASVRFRDSRRWIEVEGTVFRKEGCHAEYRATLDLRAGRGYQYQVSAEGPRGPVWSPVELFRVPPDSPSSRGWFGATFFAGNGLHPGSPNAQRVIQSIRLGHSNLLLGGGGYAHAGPPSDLTGEAAVEKWFEQAGPATARFPFLPSMDENEPMEEYLKRLSLPTGGASAYGSYSFDHSRTHYVSLNSSDRTLIDTSRANPHVAWLRDDLDAARRRGMRWIVVFTKMDFLSSEVNPPSKADLAPGLMRIFEEYGVDLVLSGEGASYERSFPTVGGKPTELDRRRATAGAGVTYLRAGTGGRTDFAKFGDRSPPEWSAARNNTHSIYVNVYEMGDWGLLIRAHGFARSRDRTRLLDSFAIR